MYLVCFGDRGVMVDCHGTSCRRECEETPLLVGERNLHDRKIDERHEAARLQRGILLLYWCHRRLRKSEWRRSALTPESSRLIWKREDVSRITWVPTSKFSLTPL